MKREIFQDFPAFLGKDPFMPMRDMIYQYLRELIITRQLEPGSRLIEEDLGEQLHASRTPIREAMRKLELEGLLKQHSGRGVVVGEISLEDALELYALCSVLEGYAARLVALTVTEEELKQMEFLLAEMELCINKNEKEQERILHRSFHMAIYKASKNKRLMKLLNDYNDYLQLFRSYYISIPSNLHQTWEEHQQLLIAFQKKDAELAEKTARHHIQMAQNAFLQQWEVYNREVCNKEVCNKEV